MLIFQQSTAGLNLESSFSHTGCLSKAKETNLPYDGFSPVCWDYRIHRLLLSRGVRPFPTECPGYDIKPSDGEATALEIWRM